LSFCHNNYLLVVLAAEEASAIVEIIAGSSGGIYGRTPYFVFNYRIVIFYPLFKIRQSRQELAIFGAFGLATIGRPTGHGINPRIFSHKLTAIFVAARQRAGIDA